VSGRGMMLSALLALQLAIVAVLLLREPAVSGTEQETLLTFERNAVDEIRIGSTEDGGAEVVVARNGDRWVLPDGHPADADRVGEVLDRLSALRAGWPVATLAAASGRFQVAAEDHQRRVLLLAEGRPVVDVYLGTSPGFQRVHARRADAEAVFSVALSNFQVPVRADEWLDKALLQPGGYLASVTRVGGWRLERDDDGWLLDGAAANPVAAARLEQRLVELRVTGIAAPPEPGLEPAAVFEIVDPQGPYRLSVFADAGGNDYRVASDRRDGYFRLAAYLADQLLLDGSALLAAEDASDGAS
jgi:hypothetical protein